MDFTDRNHIFRKSDPGHKNKENKDNANNNEPESIAFIKRRGGSLLKQEFHREDSLNISTRGKSIKRNSDLESIKFDNYQTGSTKLMNLIKSGFHLSKFKSKSKMNLQDKRQSLYLDSLSSKSEENLNALVFDSYLTPIRVSNILLNTNNPILYAITFTSDGESFYRELVVLDIDCSMQPVHPSIVNGENHCFQIIKSLKSDIISSEHLNTNYSKDESSSHCLITKSISFHSPLLKDKMVSLTAAPVAIIRCQSATQRNEWIMRLKKHINPNIDNVVRHENILKIWIQEAKNLLPKTRYFCEIRLDKILYGRTITKTMNDTVFWGEKFEFTGLKTVHGISISVYRSTDFKKRRDKSEVVAVLNLPCADLHHYSFIEKWYSCSRDKRQSDDHSRFSQLNTSIIHPDEILNSVSESIPMVRIKARYRQLEIIPTDCYGTFIDYIIEDSIGLVSSLETYLKVKSKEEFVNTLLLILENKKRHLIFLADIVLMEVFRADENVLLRGNSMASKAMESYLKMIGGEYLSIVLSEVIEQVTVEQLDCEVDPLKIQKDQSVIISNQKKLLNLVEIVWNKIYNNSQLLPNDLKSVFSMIRDKLAHNRPQPSNVSPMIDQVISSCLFLRFICPAIMSPFLFGLTNEYPDKPCINRTFTLIAKCIQSLANFTQYSSGKEAYMGFLQKFLSSKANEMKSFILNISTNRLSSKVNQFPTVGSVENPQTCSPSKSVTTVDLGYQLAELSYQLTFYLREIPLTEYSKSLMVVRSILEGISNMSPRLESEEDDRSNNTYTSNNPRSQIPVRRLSTSPSLPLNQYQRSVKTLGSMPASTIAKPNIVEDFSYIPDKYATEGFCSQNVTQEVAKESYGDYENIESKLYDESYMWDESQQTVLKSPKLLNEKEINDNWNKVVENSHKYSISGEKYHNIDTMSGFQSLKLQKSASTQHKDISRHSSQRSEQSVGPTHDDLNKNCHSQKLAPNRPANSYRRIQRNSNVMQSNNSTEIKSADKTEITPTSKSASLNNRFDTLDSLENLLVSENNSLDSNTSVSPIFQRRGSNNTTNQIVRSTESGSFNIIRRNFQSLSDSISSNVDLDSFLVNELARLQLFFEYYKVTKPIMYQDSAIEQYNRKILDENMLKFCLLKKLHLSREDIISYITASYRLLKTINKPGQIVIEFIIKSVIEINQIIQMMIKKEFQIAHMDSQKDPNFINKTGSMKLSLRKSSLDHSAMFSQLSPLSKLSKESQQYSMIYDSSPESNSNFARNVEVFERL